ncbi:hypothetical protein GDO81_020643 [Engystomops pustulosus]|uniref:Ig-like domain-containing protein n=1 Tax=Engystomops pustulosus TaxID=76066 RepID=A0AAV6Z819_ENGPU|nr:hypothetical protein GDO81_020643 [Engystomops pustulosus]
MIPACSSVLLSLSCVPTSVFLLTTIPACYNSNSDVVRVRRGELTVLHCWADPGDTLLQVTWKLHLYNSSCVISYKIEENDTETSYSSCSTRMRSDNLSLSISDTDVTDEGTYTCIVINDKRTFSTDKSLQVLAPPSTFLRLTSDGSAECGATGGNPPAEISWIPHSHDINTTVLGEPDRTWSVISTFSSGTINETSVTCVVSHPTFVNPWTGDIRLRGYGLRLDNILRLIIIVIVTILIAGVLYVKLKQQEQKIPGEQINEES